MAGSLNDHEPSVTEWTQGFNAGVQAIAQIGRARPGDRTMLDALLPAGAAALACRSDEVLSNMARAADEGAQLTATMKPRAGRASYIGDRVLGNEDGGARAVALVLAALAKHTSQ